MENERKKLEKREEVNKNEKGKKKEDEDVIGG